MKVYVLVVQLELQEIVLPKQETRPSLPSAVQLFFLRAYQLNLRHRLTAVTALGQSQTDTRFQFTKNVCDEMFLPPLLSGEREDDPDLARPGKRSTRNV